MCFSLFVMLLMKVITSLKGMEAMSLNREGVEKNNDEVNVEQSDLFVDSIESIWNVDFQSVSIGDVEKYEFSSLEMAYEFYNAYGKINGFAIRRYKVRRDVNNFILWQTFTCCRQGHREKKYLENANSRREPRPLTRCGREAYM